jgi:hypothetical protein
VLKALDVEAQHGRQAVHRHLLDGVLRAAAAAADPVLGRAQALWAHKALQAAQQADRLSSCPMSATKGRGTSYHWQSGA